MVYPTCSSLTAVAACYKLVSTVDRRLFMQFAAAAPLLGSPAGEPVYRVVSAYKPAAQPGMPGPYPGQVVRVHSENSIDPGSEKVNRELVKQMLASGMKTLTGDARTEDCWARFISPKDVVGIKVNCSGAPRICSSPEVVAGIAENLIAVGVPAKQIYVYERFDNQLQSVGYDKYLPAGVNIHAVETSRQSILRYDPKTYVETSFFGEDDTRSNVVRLVSETLTKNQEFFLTSSRNVLGGFKDEITDVQRSHNIMRDQLLKQYESLEEQVRIKTAELHNKMEELQVALSRVEEEKLNTQNALQVKEEALSTQERLMHSVAHDLKTPVNGILSPIESCRYSLSYVY